MGIDEIITLVDESPDKLRKVTWKFWFYRNRLVVDSYTVDERSSRRHTYKWAAGYERLRKDGSIKEAELPLTDEIRERAIREFMSRITVVRWSEVER